MHLGQTDRAQVDASRDQRRAGKLRRDARIGVARVEHVLGRRAAGERRADADARGEEDRLLRPLQRLAHRGDVAFVFPGVLEERLEIVIECAMDHRISRGRAAGERLGLFQITAMDVDAGRFEPPGAGVGAGEAEHLVTCRE